MAFQTFHLRCLWEWNFAANDKWVAKKSNGTEIRCLIIQTEEFKLHQAWNFMTISRTEQNLKYPFRCSLFWYNSCFFHCGTTNSWRSCGVVVKASLSYSIPFQHDRSTAWGRGSKHSSNSLCVCPFFLLAWLRFTDNFAHVEGLDIIAVNNSTT